MRGFRHQIDGLCGDPRDGGHKPASDPSDSKAVAAGLKVCHDLNLTVTLAYCYVSPWWNTVLTSTMLANLDVSLGAMRAGGVSVLLNFAYEDGLSIFLFFVTFLDQSRVKLTEIDRENELQR